MARSSGRYGNRIAKGTFSIDGTAYHVPINNAPNALHGGPLGFSTKVWTAREIPHGVEMTLVSPDGDMGFPGELTVHVRYTLQGSSLHIVYSATTTKPTVVNLTNHAYFNLAGDGQGTILPTLMMIDADRYTPVDAGADSDRRAGTGGGNAVRLPQADGDRRAHWCGERAVEVRRRLRPQLRAECAAGRRCTWRRRRWTRRAGAR